MTAYQAILLGFVQGVTEFLPISSTAHVRVVPALLGWPDPGAAFSAVIQLGTLGAVLIYFARDLARLAAAWGRGLVKLKPLETQDARLSWGILLATVPIGVLGLIFQERIESDLRSLYVISSSLIGLAVFLFAAERLARHRRCLGEATFLDTQLVGLAQALALIPGASRSGTTITGGLFLGFRREAAARFSFLVGIPAIAASGLFELKALLDHGLGGEGLFTLLLATAVAFVSGYLAIAFLLRFLRTHSTDVFVIYRIVLGVLILGLLQSGMLRP